MEAGFGLDGLVPEESLEKVAGRVVRAALGSPVDSLLAGDFARAIRQRKPS